MYFSRLHLERQQHPNRYPKCPILYNNSSNNNHNNGELWFQEEVNIQHTKISIFKNYFRLFFMFLIFWGIFCFDFLPISIVVTSSEAVTTTSQLQARLSQPPSATGNREQLRYLLQRGPASASTSTAAATAASNSSSEATSGSGQQISLSATTTTSAAGVTTTKVWVPGDSSSRVEVILLMGAPV